MINDLTIAGMIAFEAKTGRSFFEVFEMKKATDLRDVFYASCLSGESTKNATIEEATEMLSKYINEVGLICATTEIKKAMCKGLNIEVEKKNK